MIQDTTAVADDAAARSLKALDEDGSEVIILGCTIIAGCLEREIMTTGRHRELPILNPNLLALKAAETLADLHRCRQVRDQPRRPVPAPRAARRGRGRRRLAALAARRHRPPRGGRVTVETHTVGHDRARVVADYLGVAAGERFAIVVDTRTGRRDPRRPRRAPRATSAREPVVVRFAPRAAERRGATGAAAAAMAAADVVLCAASTSLYHTTAKAAAQRAGARGDFNAPYRADAWANGAMTADFFAIREQAERLAALWRTHPRGPGHVAGRHGPAGDGRGARADGLADRHLPEPGRGVGAARRRGVAAADRGHGRGRRRLGAGRLGPRARSRRRSGSRSATGARSAIAGGASADRLRDIVGDGAATPTTSARSGSGSTPRPGSPTRSPRRRRRSARSTSRSAIRPTSTAAWSSAMSTSTVSSWPRRSSSTAEPVVVDGAPRLRRAVSAIDVSGAEGPRDHRADARRRGRRATHRGRATRSSSIAHRVPRSSTRTATSSSTSPASFAAATLGHSHPDVIAAVTAQIGRASPRLVGGRQRAARRLRGGSRWRSRRPASTGCCSASAARMPTTPRSSSRAR